MRDLSLVYLLTDHPGECFHFIHVSMMGCFQCVIWIIYSSCLDISCVMFSFRCQDLALWNPLLFSHYYITCHYCWNLIWKFPGNKLQWMGYISYSDNTNYNPSVKIGFSKTRECSFGSETLGWMLFICILLCEHRHQPPWRASLN